MDESGVLLAPLVRRTWAPCGRTPVLPQRTRRREKVSLAAALWFSPHHERLEWCFQTLANAYYDNERIAAFVRKLLVTVGGRLILVWDGGGIHRGGPIRELLAQTAGRLILEPLPPYAPELNPVEAGWSWLKYGRLCNFAALDVHELRCAVLREMKGLHYHQNLLRGFFATAKLPLPRTLLT